MGRNALAILVAAWALVGMPALCVAGVIHHACEPGGSDSAAAADCPGHDDSCGPDAPGCGHEGDCDQDPCHGLAARPQSPEGPPASGPTGLVAVESRRTDLPLRTSGHVTTRDIAARRSCPVHAHPSDLPLLI